MDIQIVAKAEDVNNSTKEINSIEKEIKTFETQYADAEKKLNETKHQLIHVEGYLEKNNEDSHLVSKLTGIDHQLGGLKEFFEKEKESTRALAKAKREKQASSENFADLDKSFKKVQTEFTHSNHQVEHLTELLHKHLKSNDLSQWRNDLEGLKERFRVLEKISEGLKKLSQAEEKRLNVKISLKTLTEKKTAYEEQIKGLSKQEKEQAEEKELLEKNSIKRCFVFVEQNISSAQCA